MKNALHLFFDFIGGFYNVLAMSVTGLMWISVLHLSGTSFIVLLVLCTVLDAFLHPVFKSERAKHGLPELIEWEDE